MADQTYSDRTAFTSDGSALIDLRFLSSSGSDRDHVRSFKDAGDVLVDKLLSASDGLRDYYLVYSIGFLYRHYLELACKYLRTATRRLGSTKPPLDGHNLKKLWDEIRREIEEQFPDFTSVPFDSVQSIVYQFHTADESGQEFRYATTKLAKAHVPSLQKIPSRISIESLSSAIDRASTFLDQWAFELDNRNGIVFRV